MRHLEILQPDDVVVYDRGYFSYVLLHRHLTTGIHAIFRLQENSCSAVTAFFVSPQIETEITWVISPQRRAEILSQCPDLDIVPLKLRLLKYTIAGTVFCLGATLMDTHRYPLAEFIDVYHGRWGIEELYKVSKRIIIIEDFHGQSERAVKQELFAHFVLITLNRLFANQADIEINSERPPSSHNPATDRPGLKTNFKNCIHVLERGLEELLFLHQRAKGVVQRIFDTIRARYQRVRPNRSFIRRSMRPESKWRSSHEKKRPQKTQKPVAAPA